jgi:hypothetical protein
MKMMPADNRIEIEPTFIGGCIPRYRLGDSVLEVIQGEWFGELWQFKRSLRRQFRIRAHQ